MLLVEVLVPSLGCRYDFELEETSTVEVLLREMIAVICQKERCQCVEGEQGLSVYGQTAQNRLPMEAALWECGIKSGDCLILI